MKFGEPDLIEWGAGQVLLSQADDSHHHDHGFRALRCLEHQAGAVAPPSARHRRERPGFGRLMPV
jgi:hypothetical protein